MKKMSIFIGSLLCIPVALSLFFILAQGETHALTGRFCFNKNCDFPWPPAGAVFMDRTDTDLDGVYDTVDQCPGEVSAANNGCTYVVPEIIDLEYNAREQKIHFNVRGDAANVSIADDRESDHKLFANDWGEKPAGTWSYSIQPPGGEYEACYKKAKSYRLHVTVIAKNKKRILTSAVAANNTYTQIAWIDVPCIRPPIPGYWSELGACSKACGPGKARRVCIPPQNGGAPCPAGVSEEENCNLMPCGRVDREPIEQCLTEEQFKTLPQCDKSIKKASLEDRNNDTVCVDKSDGYQCNYEKFLLACSIPYYKDGAWLPTLKKHTVTATCAPKIRFGAGGSSGLDGILDVKSTKDPVWGSTSPIPPTTPTCIGDCNGRPTTISFPKNGGDRPGSPPPTTPGDYPPTDNTGGDYPGSDSTRGGSEAPGGSGFPSDRPSAYERTILPGTEDIENTPGNFPPLPPVGLIGNTGAALKGNTGAGLSATKETATRNWGKVPQKKSGIFY